MVVTQRTIHFVLLSYALMVGGEMHFWLHLIPGGSEQVSLRCSLVICILKNVLVDSDYQQSVGIFGKKMLFVCFFISTWVMLSQVEDTSSVSRPVIGVQGQRKGKTLLLFLKEFTF